MGQKNIAVLKIDDCFKCQFSGFNKATYLAVGNPMWCKEINKDITKGEDDKYKILLDCPFKEKEKDIAILEINNCMKCHHFDVEVDDMGYMGRCVHSNNDIEFMEDDTDEIAIPDWCEFLKK